jgi:lipoprotein-releasing system permease protein
MGFPLDLALRYLRSKKRAFVSVGTLFATMGVALGVAALVTVVSVTGGFREQFRDKVLGVNAHVLILKYVSDFREYRKVMDQMKGVPGVTGIAPFVISPMMVTHGNQTATGVLLKGVDPELMPRVLDLPKHITQGSTQGLRLPGSKPPERRRAPITGSMSSSDKGSGSKSASQQPVLDQIEKLIAEDEADAGGHDATDAGKVITHASTHRPEHAAEPEDELDTEISADAPVGSIEPDKGYESVLPDDDVLPEEVDPDPCKSAESRAGLPGIIIGSTLGRNLSAKIGDCLQVTSPTIGFSYSAGAIRAPVAKQFRVIAVFDAGFDQYDSKLVYTDLYEAQAFYDSGDSVTGIEMKVADIDRARDIARDVDRRLGSGLYHTMDWEELNHGLFTALRIQQILMSLVLALIIVVAAFTVIATLIMIVFDKKREIAVLKAMGAKDNALLRAFLYQGTFIGVIGTAVGLATAAFVCKGLLVYGFPLDPKVYFISRLPVQVRVEHFVLVGIFAVLVCLFATVWPAWYAARLRPADAFREQQ